MSTNVTKEVKLTLGGCLPLGSEITSVDIDCDTRKLIIVQLDERGNQTTFEADLCPDDSGTDTDISAVAFDHASGQISITENGNTLTATINLCTLVQSQTASSGMFIGG